MFTLNYGFLISRKSEALEWALNRRSDRRRDRGSGHLDAAILKALNEDCIIKVAVRLLELKRNSALTIDVTVAYS